MYVNALYQNSWHITLAWRLSLLRLLLPWWINTIIKASQGEKGLFASLSLLILKEVRTGTQTGHEFKPGGRSWCRGHGEVLLTGLLYITRSAWLLIEPRTLSPGMAPPTVGWALPHWSWRKVAYCWILWSHFLHWGSFLPAVLACVKLTHKASQSKPSPLLISVAASLQTRHSNT